MSEPQDGADWRSDLAEAREYGDRWRRIANETQARVVSLTEALERTHGTAQAMADMDSWIATECGMVDDGENYYVPVARAALADVGEGTPEVRHSNGCAINADPADGFGYCTCGAGHTDPTPPTCPTCGSEDKGLCRLMDNGTYCNAPAIDLWHTDPTPPETGE
jgi:hypothetical protein